jgi:hypothetical protein
MDFLANASAMLAAAAFGLMSGALLAEGALLVPFWLSIEPRDFLSWYKQNAARLQGFFGPLEVAAVLAAIAAGALARINGGSGRYWLTGAAILGVAVLAVFPLYFQRANTSFREGTIAIDHVQPELRRWAKWHWGRTILSIAGFSASVVAVAAG